ncbi:Zn-dependent hydrolase [Bacillus sp. 03113]|uniref:Zn-dependent hydrolase n=1 Tax=Bacillus sp. 03113 TaxID=2578211 RepID=UPI0011429120|nr:Zn-dependent hydrolase [Bacillus sp. 03113]
MQSQKILINGDRLKDELEAFANFGRTANNGVTRLALSEEDRLARDYFCKTCEGLGMAIKVDDMGNIYATLAGTENKPPIVMGSHIDSVKKGGRFDGILGVVAGLEVVKTLVDNEIKPRIPIMIVNYTNEEGARFEPSMMASGVISGKFERSDMVKKKDINGISFEVALKDIGYLGEEENRLQEATAFLEMHIEQGPVLERDQLSIGVVEGVVGMVCYDIEVLGESDHAGTTPMDMRMDALFVATDYITEIRKKLSHLDEELVFTIGRVSVQPNIHTVIPNKVVFSFEARHKDEAIISIVEKTIKEITNDLQNKDGCSINISKLWDRQTVWFDKTLCDALEKSTQILGYSYRKMISGAGHDAQYMAKIIPTAMLFVPSDKGKSHCEEENTPIEYCEKGVNVLLETVLTMLDVKE